MNKILSNVVIHKDYSKDIVRILKSNRSDEVIRKKLSKYHENDIADAVKLLDKDTRIRLYKILGEKNVKLVEKNLINLGK